MPIEPAEFEARLVEDFTGEKRESGLFPLAAVVAIAAVVALFRSAGPYRGMIAPLLIIGVIQVGVGGAVLFRTDRQVATLTARLAEDPAALRREETARMAKVMAGFR